MDAKYTRNQKIDNYLAKATIIVNIILMVSKMLAAYLSNSLSVISSVVDSAMDLTSGAIIWFTIKAIEKTDKYKYPIGKNR
uniref:Cation efflux protein transmembrane domain-containing protein n=1 Tax=Acrobeloides nanus TaxID=290746 RepID=A0A914DLJ5_9BILA